MSALNNIKQNDEYQQITAMLVNLITEEQAAEKHLRKLTKAVVNLQGCVQASDVLNTENLSKILQSLEQASPQSDDETKNRLGEIEKTLATMAETLSTSKTVTLPGGGVVKQSDFDAFKMVSRIGKQLETTATASDNLATAVRDRGTISIDPDKLADHAVKVLDARLVKAVDARIGVIEQSVASIGAQQAAEAAQRAEQITAKAETVVRSVSHAGRRVEDLSGRVTWVAAGRLGLALLPLAAVLLVVGGLTIGAFHVLGIGPLLGWAWSSFVAAEVWSAKVLIAMGTLGGIFGFGCLIWWLSRKLNDTYARW